MPHSYFTTEAVHKKIVMSALFCILLLEYYNSFSQTYPAGFSQVQVATGISSPTAMSQAPDGRIFIAQRHGALRVFKNGALLPTPFVSLIVNTSGERGLLGIAFDPAFATNNFVYLHYTDSSGTNNRISRFTANGDVAVPGSELIILNLDTIGTATIHYGGTMQFGPDGKLYLGIGDNANSANAQNLDTFHGKVIRINSDGTPAPGNPFSTGTIQRRSVWAYGMRNPFTLNFQPGTGRLHVNDVGEHNWEEINNCTMGGLNYGWPAAEGNSTNPAFANPVYAYAHGTGTGQGCAITGGAFFNPPSSNYPSQYTGNYFYLDYCNNWIDRLTIVGSTVTRFNFATNIAGLPIGLMTGSDGNLYFLSRATSSLYRISYTTSTAPVITTQPQSITVAQGNNATFSVTATGSAPLSYQWRKNGINISGANAGTYTITNVQTSHAGTYSVLVSNSAGSVTSNNAILTVTSPNQPPDATISTPVAGITYAAGTNISFSGTGTDPENGTLAASAFEWFVIFHHDTHTHPGPSAPGGVTSGSFSIPNIGETSTNVFYRLYLVVTDLQGARDTAFRDILPRTSSIVINTSPQGLGITVDGQPFTAPYTFSGVEGMLRSIGTTSPQTINNALTYTFSSWSHGGAQTQNITTPVNDINYTANFTATLRNADNPAATVNGLNYSYYHGTWSVLPNFTTLTPVASGVVNNFDTPRTQNDSFAFRYTGYVTVPTDGLYSFFTSSDDGSKLYIGSTVVVNNDGMHSYIERTGQTGLKAGKHAITVEFFERAGSEYLTVSYQGPGISKQVIPNSALFRSLQSVILNPVADSYVRGGNYANSNYGSSTSLYSRKSTGSGEFESYLRFNISSFGRFTSSAKLRLYGKITTSSTPTFPVEVLNVSDNTWQETGITYNNKPAPSGTALATVTISGTTYVYYEWDITQQVNSLISAGVGSISLLVRNTVITNSARFVFNSREAASNKPQIVIVNVTPRFADTEPGHISTLPPVIPEQVRVYPQPASETVNLYIPEHLSNTHVRIIDLNGSLITEFTLSEAGDHELPVGMLNNGIYVLYLRSPKGTASIKLLIDR